MPTTPRRRRDRTFLHLAAFAGLGGLGAIATSIVATVLTWRLGHPTTTFFFFSLWGIAALAGAAANIVVYFQSGDPPEKPPRGGQKVTPLRLLETRPSAPAAVAEPERKAA
ncbi:MAG: hypothetical protein NVS2B3_08720 [Vulcanimicrobiaceae bacterium]